jgi:cysteine synthase
MKNKASTVFEEIGNTPLFRLDNICKGNIFGKAEYLNPGGSIKDRVAYHILAMAKEDGTLRPGDVIVEATSGNTGIGVSFVGTQMGHRVIVIMPENMSDERKKLITALGGELVLTPAEESLDGCLAKLAEIQVELGEKCFIPGQFTNPRNPEIHYLTTGKEIWEQMEGKVDVFVCAIGSGGSLTGVGRYLKERNPKVQIVAVEPKNSAALLGREPGLHQIQGIGDGFVPEVVDRNLIDMVMTVSDEDAVETTRALARKEGILVGTSSGANLWCALHFNDGTKRVVTLFPDRIERYFSTALI